MKQNVPILPANGDLPLDFTSGEAVVLYGAGPFVSPTVHALAQHDVSPACICDESPAEYGSSVPGLPLLTPSEAQAAFPHATVVLTTAPALLDTTRSRAAALGWTNIGNCAHLLASFEYDATSFPSGLSWLHFDLDRYFYEYFSIHHPDVIILPSMDIVITERCSLRCRNCANLMQYYVEPHDVEMDGLFTSLDILMQCVDHVLEFRVTGGETFMNKRAHEYVTRLRRYKNYTRIAIYSNGTIIPKKESIHSFAFHDTYFRISDYGPLSRSLRDLTTALDKHEVTYDVDAMPGWHDCAEIDRRNRTKAELEAVFSTCCANKLFTLLNNRLYPCPFAANATNLGALPFSSDDGIDFVRHSGRMSIRKQLVRMLREKTRMSACEYCAGRPFGVLPLPVAVQTQTPLPYRKWSIDRG